MGRRSSAASRLAVGVVVCVLLGFLVALAWVRPSAAHPMSFGSVRLERQEQRLSGDLVLDVPDFVLAQPDDTRRAELVEQVRTGFRIETGALALRPAVHVRELGHGSNAVDVVEVSYDLPPGTTRLRFVASSAIGDVAVELVDSAQGLRERSVVAAGTESRWLELTRTAEPSGPASAPSGETVVETNTAATSSISANARSFVDYLLLGFHHIVPEGVDHLLFVLSLVFLVEGWAALFVLLSVFTLGHTLSVAITLFGGPSVPADWVEPLIALSLAYAALEEARPAWAKLRLFVVIAFGLVHGLGFAGALGQVRVPSDERVVALFGFNLGVEIGQLVVAGLGFALLVLLHRRWALTNTRRNVVRVIAGVGVTWALFRVLGG